MTAIQLFAAIILPLAIVAGAAGIVFGAEARQRRRHHPAE